VEPAFNSSLGALSRRLKTPWLLYVPFYCVDNVYTDRYRFLHGNSKDKMFAVPHPEDAPAFYRELMAYGVANGMAG
jgi:hypothetical protein